MQYRLDSALLDILKKDSDGRLGRWREQSIALGLLVTEAKRKVDDDVDDTDFKDIQESAVQLQVGKILFNKSTDIYQLFLILSAKKVFTWSNLPVFHSRKVHMCKTRTALKKVRSHARHFEGVRMCIKHLCQLKAHLFEEGRFRGEVLTRGFILLSKQTIASID